jgi:hypothetical protein
MVVRGTERLPVALKRAALMSLSSGTNSAGFGIREIDVFGFARPDVTGDRKFFRSALRAW